MTATKTHPLDSLLGVELIFLSAFEAFKNVWARGDSIVLNLASIESTIDRNGDSFLTLLDDPESQVRRWGVHVFTRAEALDAPIEPWIYGDAAWERDRMDARREAAQQPAGPLRQAALKAVDDRFGPPPSSTTILREVRGDDGSRPMAR